jgi:hypothetical protein
MEPGFNEGQTKTVNLSEIKREWISGTKNALLKREQENRKCYRCVDNQPERLREDGIGALIGT